jgi:hypothetical protein
MQGYPTVTPESNTFPQLMYRVPRWTMEQRRARLRWHNPRYKSRRGVRRRDHAELGVRDALLWIAALLRGQHAVTLPKGKTHELAPWLYQRMGAVTPAIWRLRCLIRERVSWIVVNGPASGWGVAQQVGEGETTSPFTPYYVPTGSRSAAEAWLRFVRRTEQMVRLVVALARKVRPTPRSAGKQEQPRLTAGAVPASKRETASRRDRGPGEGASHSPPGRGGGGADEGPPREGAPTHVGVPLATYLDQLRRKFGEGGDDER